MAVLLKNLVARTLQTEDFGAISELLAACENAECSMADSSLEDLLSYWQRADFHLADDAWVIVTTRGQIVGFACIWHENYTLISTFLVVHPEYRQRGIGTLLLRLIEERARQYVRLAQPGARVVMLAQVCRENKDAQRLFEREGFCTERQLLRISFMLAEDTGSLPASKVQKKLRADMSLQQGQLFGTIPLYDHDGLCNVRFYITYEKELRPASPDRETQRDIMASLS